jgi:hypothetical protein
MSIFGMFGGKEEKVIASGYDKYTLAGAFSALIVLSDKINEDNVQEIITGAGLTDEQIQEVVEAFPKAGALEDERFDLIRGNVMTAVNIFESKKPKETVEV